MFIENDKKMKPYLRQELLNKPEKLDILTLVQDFKDSLIGLNNNIYLNQAKEIAHIANIIYEFLSSAGIDLKIKTIYN